MELLAHRGWWLTPSEKNARSAFQRAFAAGYGVETDIRDCNGELVVSHDAPRADADPDLQMSLSDFLDLYESFKNRSTLALNIKADGLYTKLSAILKSRSIKKYFVFDMSIPDTIGYITVGMSVYMRRSEFEFGSTLEFHSGGLWLDAFERPFIPAAEILECVDAGKFAAVVSPELHRKPHMEAWQSWRNLYLDLEPEKRQRIMLCTDFPKEAEEFFGLSQ